MYLFNRLQVWSLWLRRYADLLRATAMASVQLLHCLLAGDKPISLICWVKAGRESRVGGKEVKSICIAICWSLFYYRKLFKKEYKISWLCKSVKV